MRSLGLLGCAVVAAATLVAGSAGADTASSAFVRPVTLLAADAGTGDAGELLAWSFRKPRTGEPRSREPRPQAARTALGADRARILLRSLTLPGWGQATLGQRRSATVFGLAETAIWGTFTAFRIQVTMREQTYIRTAWLMAGINLKGRGEEWRRIVGSFASSEEYNRLVVARDAANLYYEDPVAYRAYIEAHSLTGADAWSWQSVEAQARYRSQRISAQNAAKSANTMLAAAVANRVLSAVHAARSMRGTAPGARSWRLEAVPVAGQDPTAFQFRVHARF